MHRRQWCGLNTERSRPRRPNGLVSEAELEKMTEAQIHSSSLPRAFQRRRLTSVSGRGVGMTVRTNIDQIGGTIDIKSVAGRAPRYHQIPLTLAIVSALIVEAAGDRFAIRSFSV